MMPGKSARSRAQNLDWEAIGRGLNAAGWVKTPPLLTPRECGDLARLWTDEERFRTRIEMARYRFGEGAYKYFKYPLPELVAELRELLYPPLAAIANQWQEALGAEERYPASLDEYLARCHRAGQTRPTPLLLRYEAGGYNCLHQDLYGDLAFPLQATCFLRRPDQDYTGGEFLLVEQRPRAQSRGEAIRGEQGEVVIFPTRYRPVRGARGHYRVVMRHGVSTVRSGERCTLGVIFHDAR